ncbi:hypothetical protein BVRB_9g210580 [Beta vulgaris subsp. vulgaris]|nr:hypothetical protein BVRB_9g210580 [Beta vulgaris subsp. vulgaris]
MKYVVCEPQPEEETLNLELACLFWTSAILTGNGVVGLGKRATVCFQFSEHRAAACE